jgi:hypothetical protein
MLRPLYVGYFTQGTPYEREAAELVVTLDGFGLEHEIVGVPDLGDWTHNCAQKPNVVREAMGKHPDRPIVYLDADARVIRRPELFDALDDRDFAGHWLGDEELISACLYFAPTPAAAELLRRWHVGCKDRPDVWDQKTLQAEVEAFDGLRVTRLPPEYNWIQAVDGHEDISQRHYGERSPVIVQRQASRRLRR